MNLYKKNILKHVMPMNPRRHHKYLYIDANGNYVYPKDVAKKAGNKARDLNAQGQADAVNVRKERAERIKAGNNRMAAKLKGIYDQGQANNVNAHKARAESINAGNEIVANSKAYKIGKTILEESTAGRKIKRFNKHANDLAGVVDDINIPKGNKVKPKRKTPEEIAREDAELERSISEKMSEFAAHEAEEYYKDQAKKKSEQLPKGWVRDQNGYVYDDIRAMAVDPNDPAYNKKKKRAKKNVAKVVKTSVTHSDTYRSNVMNSHQRMIYSSQLQHAERRNHKYLYKIGDRYIYPEDVAGKAKSTASNIGSMATAAGTAAKTKISNAIAEQKQKQKDRKFVKEGPYKNSPYTSDYDRARQQTDQISYAHRESTGKKDKGTMSNTRNVALDYVRQTDKYPSEKAKSLVKQKEKTKQRKEEAANKEFLAERKKINQQRKSAHAGYEADKKAFPEGGSTEELERQKAKTHARKRLKGDEVNRFRRDPAIDNDPEVKAARKKWLGKEENDGRNTVTADSAAGRSINAHKMYDSVNRTPHEGAKRKASWEKYSAGQKSGDARREYLAARQRAAEKDYLTQTRKARETKARTEDTVERMRKKKKRSSR